MNWKIVEIKQAGIEISDGNYSSKYPRSEEFVNYGVPFIRANNFSNKNIIDTDMYFITPEKHMLLKKGHLKKNDVLITTRGNIGEVALVTEKHENSNINAQIALLRVQGNLYHKYLLHVFDSYFVKKQLTKLTTGTALKQLPIKNLNKIKIPLPPLPIQKKIAEILDSADALKQKDKALIAKYNELTQSLFLDMFGDTWTNLKNWPLRALSTITQPEKIITYGIVQAGPNVEDGVPYIKSSNIKGNKILVNDLMKTSNQIANAYQRSKCSTGDIIMSIRATVGTIAFLPVEIDGANLTQGTARISPNEDIINPIYLFYCLLSKGVQLKIELKTKGATFKEITLKSLRNIEIPLPPINLQNEFAERVKIIEQQKQLAEQSLKKSEDLFNCLLQKAFKGELVS